MGRKDPKGTILNSAGVGTQVQVKGTGEIEVIALGTTVTINNSGVTISTKAAVINTTGNLTATVGGNALVDAAGTGKLKTGGACDIEAGGAVSIKASGNSMNGGVITDNAINNDPITGIPLTAVGGITTL